MERSFWGMASRRLRHHGASDGRARSPKLRQTAINPLSVSQQYFFERFGWVNEY